MEEIQQKMEYCLNCKSKPCKEGCPLKNDIPAFIENAKNGNIKEAYKILSKTTIMPFICGKICPHSKQCEGKCIRGIKEKPVSIGEIESYVGEIGIKNKWYLDVEKAKEKDKKIAIIGAGPAGITASIYLAKMGWRVDLFEQKEKIGGILRYGIPRFRLEERYVDILEEELKCLNVKIYTEISLGRDRQLKKLIEEYDAVLFAIGANQPSKMGIPGEEQKNVIGANELLEYGNHPNYEGKKVVVIGGGNVAMDASRTIKRLGAESVTVLYRRAREQMPAEKKEVEEAIKEKINFKFQINVKGIEKNQLECIRTVLVKKEDEKREIPVEIPNSTFYIEADYIIMAIGSKLNKEGLDNIELNEKGYIKINDKYQTNLKKVYATGDSIGKNTTVAWASYFGREAAKNIEECDSYSSSSTLYL